MNHSRSTVVLGSLLLASLVGGCSQQQAAPPPPAAPVSVAKVEQKAVPLELRVIGAVEAYSTVDVKAQVDGQLTGVHFTEGQDVRKGQLLFSIDRAPFEAELQRAEASLARNQAQAQNAQVQAARYTRLVGEGVVAKEQYEDVITNAEALEAAVRADKAAVENAKLRLAYTSIHSPIDGRTGSLKVHRGNIVKANDEKSTLVVINQLTPIYSSFALPEQDLSEVRRYMAAGTLKVEAAIPQDAGPPAQGTVTFVDNAVDRTTGTIRLKATFPNHDRRLWPGQFVNVVLTLAEQKDALVVPSEAVQTGQQGMFVWVVKPDLTVESRPVTVARARQNEAVISRGLAAGETVVTDGHLRLMPGGRVQIKNGPNGRAGQ
ncbi:MAG: efflux RND transporter periplasmic adaptor subunit [Acidobacteria bacterium]|nr:efflux RND transporter periplasmic adaptor subunit [Acidobacteriota bacterium]